MMKLEEAIKIQMVEDPTRMTKGLSLQLLSRRESLKSSDH